MTIEAYPLHWPAGWPRTKYPDYSAFKCTMAEARDMMFAEISRLGGRSIVLSTNIELRLDGLPYANRRSPEDTGVAVYFERKGVSMVFACDKWRTVKENIRSIQKTIEALRGIERWGASDMMERAFTGFAALPAPGADPQWFEVLGVSQTARVDEIKTAYLAKAREYHPDNGGSNDLMSSLNAARDHVFREIGCWK